MNQSKQVTYSAKGLTNDLQALENYLPDDDVIRLKYWENILTLVLVSMRGESAAATQHLQNIQPPAHGRFQGLEDISRFPDAVKDLLELKPLFELATTKIRTYQT